MAEKLIRVYLSPSNHGVNQNKCLHAGCYEDKHTRPIAEQISKHLLSTKKFEVKIAAINKTISERIREAENWDADLYIPIHTNACGTPSARYVLFMSWKTTGKYAKLYNSILPYIDDIYDAKIYHRQATNLIEINSPSMQTIYCEFGFHTNETDCDKYIHSADIFGKAFAKGICKHYGVTFKDVVVTAPPASTSKKNVLVVDGEWGKNTTLYLQKLLNCKVKDGIISNQLNKCKKFLPGADTGSWKFNAIGYGGSATIKAMQKVIGATVDGYAGEGTVEALQSFLKRKGYNPGAIDGIMGTNTVKALQMYINAQF